MKLENVNVEKNEHVATVTINYPEKLNILTPGIIDQLSESFTRLREQLDVRCVVMTGTGRAFCAGADVATEADAGAKEILEFRAAGRVMFDRIEYFRTPVIMAINGYALGGGAELSLVGDYRIAAESARVGFPEARFSALPAWSALWALPKLVGESRARRLLFTGEYLPAREAEAVGLVDEVVEDVNLLPAAHDLAETIASQPPLGIELLKRALNYGDSFKVDEMGPLTETEDAKEAYAAFCEKREPRGFNRR